MRKDHVFRSPWLVWDEYTEQWAPEATVTHAEAVRGTEYECDKLDKIFDRSNWVICDEFVDSFEVPWGDESCEPEQNYRQRVCFAFIDLGGCERYPEDLKLPVRSSDITFRDDNTILNGPFAGYKCDDRGYLADSAHGNTFHATGGTCNVKEAVSPYYNGKIPKALGEYIAEHDPNCFYWWIEYESR